MNKEEFFNKLKSIGIKDNDFRQYIKELKDFLKCCENSNSFIMPTYRRRKDNKYRHFITHLFIDKDIDNIFNILIKDDKGNYYIAWMENDNYNLYDAIVKGYDNYVEKHRDKINDGERIEDINDVLKYIDYKYIKNIDYEGRVGHEYYGQNSFIMYIPFLETNKYKCLCSKDDCYCKTAKYKYFAPLNIYKKDNNTYIIDIITIYRIKEENKYPISI